MKIKIKFFASAREQVGTNYVELDLPANSKLVQIRELLNDRYPSFKRMPGRWAVNMEFVSGDTCVSSNDEIAWIPPVSGG